MTNYSNYNPKNIIPRINKELSIELHWIPKLVIDNFKKSLWLGLFTILFPTLLGAGATYFSYHKFTGEWMLSKSNYSQTQEQRLIQNPLLSKSPELPQKVNTNTGIPSNSGGANNTPENGKKTAFEGYKNILLDLISPMEKSFDNFIFQTVDPTGFSEFDGTTGVLTNSISADKKLKFGSGQFLNTSMKYAWLLTSLVSGLIVLLIVIIGIRAMTAENSGSINWVSTTFKNLAIAIILLAGIAPALISLSIIATNQINATILSLNGGDCVGTVRLETVGRDSAGTPISYARCSLDKVLTNIVGGKPEVVTIDGWDIFGLISRAWYIFSGLFTSLPEIILGVIMLILLFVILIQYVARYIHIYFLAAIYPIVCAFWCFEKTQHYAKEYINQFGVLLIQQPFFLLGFVILSDFSRNMASSSKDISNMLLYIIFLGALTTLPGALAQKLFGSLLSSPDLQNTHSNNYFNLKARSLRQGVQTGVAKKFDETFGKSNQNYQNAKKIESNVKAN